MTTGYELREVDQSDIDHIETLLDKENTLSSHREEEKNEKTSGV